MIDYKLFIEKFYPTANDNQKDDIKRFINNLDKLIGTLPLEDALLDKQLLCSSFYLQHSANGISQPHYQKIKSYLTNLFLFMKMSEMKSIPSRAEVIASQEICCYFPSLNDLLKFIDRIGAMTLQTCNPATDLARIKSVCILGWLGLSLKEIAELKKTDLKLVCDSQSTEYNGYEIKVSNKLYYAYNEAFAPIHCLQTLDCYNGLPSGKKIMFKGDEQYLFRATSANDHHDGNAIKKIIQRFNNFIPSNEKKSIVFRVLNKNCIFLNLYNDENYKTNDSNSSLIHRIISTLRCDRTTAYTCLGQYQNFVAMLENNKL